MRVPTAINHRRSGAVGTIGSDGISPPPPPPHTVRVGYGFLVFLFIYFFLFFPPFFFSLRVVPNGNYRSRTPRRNDTKSTGGRVFVCPTETAAATVVKQGRTGGLEPATVFRNGTGGLPITDGRRDEPRARDSGRPVEKYV